MRKLSYILLTGGLILGIIATGESTAPLGDIILMCGASIVLLILSGVAKVVSDAKQSRRTRLK